MQDSELLKAVFSEPDPWAAKEAQKTTKPHDVDSIGPPPAGRDCSSDCLDPMTVALDIGRSSFYGSTATTDTSTRKRVVGDVVQGGQV